MMILLNEIREKPIIILRTHQKVLRLLLILLSGAVLGLIAKYTDGSEIGLISTGLGFWIFITTLIAVSSRSPEAAALHAFSFLSTMLIVYYIYSMVLFGFFPRSYFLAWGVIAMLSPIGGYFVWYSIGLGWKAAAFAALPISLLVVEGYSFIYTYSFTEGIDLLAALILFIILPSKKKQYLLVLSIVIGLSLVIDRFGLIYYFPS
ncbi:hypothetical protein ABN702_05375 [Bacillus haimaensis]|uniref:hypothetical protein n=1 Tax=Bacillus haimaensis TaxID=3160967 RepID=UPI003AA9DC37